MLLKFNPKIASNTCHKKNMPNYKGVASGKDRSSGGVTGVVGGSSRTVDLTWLDECLAEDGPLPATVAVAPSEAVPAAAAAAAAAPLQVLPADSSPKADFSGHDQDIIYSSEDESLPAAAVTAPSIAQKRKLQADDEAGQASGEKRMRTVRNPAKASEAPEAAGRELESTAAKRQRLEK